MDPSERNSRRMDVPPGVPSFLPQPGVSYVNSQSEAERNRARRCRRSLANTSASSKSREPALAPPPVHLLALPRFCSGAALSPRQGGTLS